MLIIQINYKSFNERCLTAESRLGTQGDLAHFYCYDCDRNHV